ncbi:MAG: hypothetical protein JO298_08785 [Verrucomicrobia bacterium]|nr:hypothetical protein [Verrucomicrobiota bacterium]
MEVTLRRAVVIRTASGADQRVACFLTLLGIEWEALTAEALVSRHSFEMLAEREIQACLIVCGEGQRDLKSELDKRQIPASMLGRTFTGILFHSFDRSPASLRALEAFLNDAKIAAPKLSSENLRYRVSDKHPDMCGALSGLSFRPIERAADCGIELELRSGIVDSVVSIGEASLLTYVGQRSRETFISSSPEILDLQEPASTNVDFRACFSKVVPILIALRYLFRGSCWTPEVRYANIVIDDPPLWPRYGHLDLRKLAALVDRTGCACTIAMIPWNYRRSDPRAVSLVANRQPHLGVCVHGCNHTSGEFRYHDPERLAGILFTTRRRMDAHQQDTGLPYQSVMVFPQGIFSVEAMSCLRTGGYLAAVNTEVADCSHEARVSLQDLLDPAVLCYDEFPLFTRRKPEDGALNFAVDSFLGKPCLVVLHHDFFKGGMKKLEELVLNFRNFHPELSWDSLENIVKGCAVSKREADGRKTMKIFANRALIRVGQSEELNVLKKEAHNHRISRVELDDRSVDFSLEEGFLKVKLTSPKGQTVSISIVPAENPAAPATEDPSGQKARVAMRRYMCDFRDNYLAKSETLLRCARGVVKLLRTR